MMGHHISEHNSRYLQLHLVFIEEIIIQPQAKAAHEDHPLNPNPNSQWQSFFKDNEVLLQVPYHFFIL